MYENLKGKKLLVIGSDETDKCIVEAAKNLGIYVIAADGKTKSATTFAKNAADESWDIDYRKTDEICAMCRAAGVNGVLAGYSEFRVLAACRIAERLGTPFYATEEQIELTRNKRRFKDECIRYGVRVPKDYCFSTPPDPALFDTFRYPVIVKPTDYAGRKGITICESPDQLSWAIEYALKLSESHTVIVEEYIAGKEFTAVYTLSDGEISLSCLNKKYLNESQKRRTGLCDLAVAPSDSVDRFLQSTDKSLKAFLRGIGAKNGVAFFQGIEADGEFYIFEMGYRLNGGNDYFLVEQERGISYMKMLIAHSLTGSMTDSLGKDDPHFSALHSCYILYAKGGTIGTAKCPKAGEITGLDDVHVCAFPGVKIVEDGSTGQRAFSFKITATSFEELRGILTEINRRSEVLDENGENMLLPFFNVDRISDPSEG